VTNSDVEIGYLRIAFALLGVILVGGLLSALHLDRWHRKLVGVSSQPVTTRPGTQLTRYPVSLKHSEST